MPAIGVLLVDDRHSKNSITVLAGALDAAGVADDVAVGFARPRDRALLAGLLPAPEKLLVAFSFATARLPHALDRLDCLRREAGRCAAGGSPREVVAVAGGPHASGDPEGTLRLGFDLVVRGEGEEALPLLASRLRDGRSLADVPGLSWLEDGRLRAVPRAPPLDLDRFPPFALRHRRLAPVELSRGCPWACRFCQTSYLQGARARARSVDSIVGHVEAARGAGLVDLRFVSSDAFAWGSPDGRTPNPERVEALLRATTSVLRGGGSSPRADGRVFFGSFPSEVRPESVTKDLVGLVRAYASNDNIVLGAQSGSPRILESLGRGHDVDVVLRAAGIILDAGLVPIVDFILGLPGEQDEDRAATRLLIGRLAGMGVLVHTHAFMPLPGTPLAEAPPGSVDAGTRRMLDSLSSQGRHIGRHRTHEAAARAAAAARVAVARTGPPDGLRRRSLP